MENRNLYLLVLKVLEESDKEEIFWGYFNNNNYWGYKPSYSNIGFLEGRNCLKFKDGEPDIGIKSSVPYSTRLIHKKFLGVVYKTVEEEFEDHENKTYIIYAGELEYKLTKEETDNLKKTYYKFLERFKKERAKIQQEKIENRLNSKISL